MSTLSLRCFWITLLVSSSLSVSVFAQQLKLDVYRIRITTKTGEHMRGLLEDVTETDVYISNSRSRPFSQQVPLNLIRKAVLRRNNKKSAIITGAIIGGLAAGYASNQSLQRNQPSNAVNYGITITFAAAGGAAGGLLVGALIGNLTSRVIRPLDMANPEISLYRQLQPFSLRYQQEFFDRVPPTR